MNCEHLDPEEFGVECEIRNLQGSLFTLLKNLTAVLEDENENHDIPQRPHEKARKQPKREIKLCSDKLLDLQALIQKSLLADPIEQDTLEGIHSRLLHVSSRLKRISSSSSVEDMAGKLLISCNSFITAIENVIADKSQLNNSREAIKMVQVEIPVLDEHDIDSDRNRKQSLNLNFGTLDNPKPGPSKENVHPLSSTINLATEDKLVTEINLNNAIADISQLLEDLTRKTAAIHNLTTNANSNPAPVVPSANNVRLENRNVSPVRFSDPPELAASNCSSHQSSSQSVSKHPTHIRVQKWNINYSSSNKDPLTVDQFLYRVHHLARVYNVSDENLVNDVQFLLSGEALQYYWLYIQTTPNATWASFKDTFISRFKDRKTDHDIKFELHSRKQHAPHETFREFYNAVLSKSYTLKVPLCADDLLALLRQNMRDGLVNELAGIGFDSVQNLVNRCVAIEDAWNKTGFIPENHYQRRRNVSEFTGTSFDSGHFFQTSTSNHNLDTFGSSVEAISQSYRNFGNNSNQIQNNRVCWNCDVVGTHHWIDCPEMKRKFCYGCGAKNLLKPNCLKCTPKPGNSQMEAKTSGILPFRNHEIRSPPTHSVEEAASNTDPELYRRQH